MTFRWRQKRRFTACMVGGLFLLSDLLSLGSGMRMNNTQRMTSCPLSAVMHATTMTGDSFLCPMTTTDHLVAWQRLFVSILPEISLLIAFVLFKKLQPFQHQDLSKTATHLYQKKARDRLVTFLDPLQRAFAKGILHAKRGDGISA